MMGQAQSLLQTGNSACFSLKLLVSRCCLPDNETLLDSCVPHFSRYDIFLYSCRGTLVIHSFGLGDCDLRPREGSITSM